MGCWETTGGLGPGSARGGRGGGELLRQGGGTSLLVEQNARRGLAAAEDGVVMELGRIKLRGKGLKLLEDPEVGRLYLGEEAGEHQIRRREKPAEQTEGRNSKP